MSSGAALLVELWRGEGARSLLARLADHLAMARRRRRFRRVELDELPRAAVLHVAATAPVPWLGGVAAQLGDRLREEERQETTALLFPWRREMRLEVTAGRRRLWALVAQRPRPGVCREDAAWATAVRLSMGVLRSRLLHVEGAAGLPPQTLLELARERPLLLALHDFALFCPRPNLYDEQLGRSCGACADAATCRGRLEACGHAAAPLAAGWRDTGGELLRAAAAIVYPSAFLRDAHRALFGQAGAAQTIAPGIPPAGSLPPRAAGGTPRIAFLGGGAPHKGAALFTATVREWQRRGRHDVEWHVLGGGGPAQLHELRRLGVCVHGYYRHGALARRLQRLGIDLVLLLPRVPESFSLVLSETLSAGVPVLAVAAGALTERLAAGGGALLDEQADAKQVASALERWVSGRLDVPSPRGPIPSTAEAAAAMLELQARLLATGVERPRSNEPTAQPAPVTPFLYPPELGDRLRNAAGALERIGGGLMRLARGGASVSEVRRASRSRRERLAEPAAAPADAPVVYLAALPWEFRFQRPQQLARALVAAGHPVLYVEGFRRARWQPRRELVAGAVSRLRLAIPGRPDLYRDEPSHAAIDALAETVVEGLGERPLMLLAQLPFWGPLAMGLRSTLRVPLVYDRIDLHTGFAGVPGSVARLETELMRGADLVLASSPVLRAGAEGVARATALVPNAVALEDFPPPRRRFGEPVVLGYVGALAGWFDAAAVGALAVARPQWRIRLAGHVESREVERLGRLGNVELLGEIPYEQVPSFLAGLHALIVPFHDQPLTRAVDPVKFYEALAAGLPVVSRRLPALARWQEPLVYAYDEGGLLAATERALDGDGETMAQQRRERASVETWGVRAEQVLALLGVREPFSGRCSR